MWIAEGALKLTWKGGKEPTRWFSPLLWWQMWLALHYGSTTPRSRKQKQQTVANGLSLDCGPVKINVSLGPGPFHSLLLCLLQSCALHCGYTYRVIHSHGSQPPPPSGLDWRLRQIQSVLAGVTTDQRPISHLDLCLLTFAHFKCLVWWKKRSIWEFIFWDKNTEFAILDIPCDWAL